MIHIGLHRLVFSICLGLLLLTGCRQLPAQGAAVGTPEDLASPTTGIVTLPLATITPSLNSSPAVKNTRPPAATATLTLTPKPSLTPTPEAGEPLVIGRSAGGRPLEVYRFGSGRRDVSTKLMILAGIHGGYEANTVALADQLIAYLRQAEKRPKPPVPEDKTLYILRALNPDGLARAAGPEGRANANGVDLNRNWDASWQAEWRKADCWNLAPITGGTRPASEPETQALAQFLLENKIDALISYHSAGLGIFSGGQPQDAASGAASKKLATLLSTVSGYRFPPAPTVCAYTGQLIDWASAHGITAVDVELNNHTETDFAINLKVLKAFLSWEAPAKP